MVESSLVSGQQGLTQEPNGESRFPVPGFPIKTIFSFRSTKANPESSLIWALLTPGCLWKGKVLSVHSQGILAPLSR